MSPEQVAAAAPADAALVGAHGTYSDNPARLQLHSGAYRTPKYAFELGFTYTNRRLSMVGLTMRDELRCYAIRDDLIGRYGTPTEKRPGGVFVMTWVNDGMGNKIKYLYTVSTCFIFYEPVVTSASGL